MALLCVSFHTARKSNKGPLDTDMPLASLTRCLSARPLLSGRMIWRRFSQGYLVALPDDGIYRIPRQRLAAATTYQQRSPSYP